MFIAFHSLWNPLCRPIGITGSGGLINLYWAWQEYELFCALKMFLWTTIEYGSQGVPNCSKSKIKTSKTSE